MEVEEAKHMVLVWKRTLVFRFWGSWEIIRIWQCSWNFGKMEEEGKHTQNLGFCVNFGAWCRWESEWILVLLLLWFCCNLRIKSIKIVFTNPVIEMKEYGGWELVGGGEAEEKRWGASKHTVVPSCASVAPFTTLRSDRVTTRRSTSVANPKPRSAHTRIAIPESTRSSDSTTKANPHSSQRIFLLLLLLLPPFWALNPPAAAAAAGSFLLEPSRKKGSTQTWTHNVKQARRLWRLVNSCGWDSKTRPPEDQIAREASCILQALHQQLWSRSSSH